MTRSFKDYNTVNNKIQDFDEKYFCKENFRIAQTQTQAVDTYILIQAYVILV